MKRIVLALALLGSGAAMATTAPQATENTPAASAAVVPMPVTPRQPLIKLQFVLRSPPPALPGAMDIHLDSSQRGIIPPSDFTKSSILLRGGAHDNPNDDGCRQYWGFNCVVW
ncbi:MAG TPA: hypothetical protein VGV14_10440 [Rhodanobacter sp.]|nr:hypothetical protein [Rhodanobacter sp.]